jgi:ATP-dependent Lhr-like helicase
LKKQPTGLKQVTDWMTKIGMQPFSFQKQTWQAIQRNECGLVNAPTGCGKTYSVFLGLLIKFINRHPNDWQILKDNGLQLLWITPLRSLAKDLARAMEEVMEQVGLPWKVGIRNGDTPVQERTTQTKRMPEILLVTPESLHLLFAQKNNTSFFNCLQLVAVDEWHELLGSKRGVQVELALTKLCYEHHGKGKKLLVWGISATIGNLEEAADVLLHVTRQYFNSQSIRLIKAKLDKKILLTSIIPDEIDTLTWAGHLGIKLAHKLIPIIENSQSTLIFINTRGMAETWYQTLLDVAPQLAGQLALHHGSIDKELRKWVEDALHDGKIKAVVCTASLDLGVDFRPVDAVIQVGSPKGVARFIQRAGRSGHQPGATSRIYFLPTHALELVEAAALRAAMEQESIENKYPMVLCFDVLIQYLCTLAVGAGFEPDQVLMQIKSCHCFSEITEEEWHQILLYLQEGGPALKEYDDYNKTVTENGRIYIKNRRLAMRHRLNIGTIVSDAMVRVQMQYGGYLGTIEEYFISRLQPGDVFIMAGKTLALVGMKDMTALVRTSNSKKALVPSWVGGRMSLTANLGHILRQTFNEVLSGSSQPEISALSDLFSLQTRLSHIPAANELLIEQIEDKDGWHLMVYPFEGRQVHESMSALLADRISRSMPVSFSMAMNDYGFELLSSKPILLTAESVHTLFSEDQLLQDMLRSINSAEMAQRKFRDIAVIGGLIVQSMPGEQKKARHLQSSASLLFKVFSDFDPDNILLRQAYREVLDQQMEEIRLRAALRRIRKCKIIITQPQQYTPLSFPIIVDGLNRYNLSSEKLEERIKRMTG